MSGTGFHTNHQTQPSRVMYINSRDCYQHGDTTTHMSYLFKEPLATTTNEGILISLLSASVPYSFYNIRQGVNDKIRFHVGRLNSATTQRAGDGLDTIQPYVTQVKVVSTELFPSTGYFKVNNEICKYMSKDDTTFIGVWRGRGGTTVAIHERAAGIAELTDDDVFFETTLPVGNYSASELGRKFVELVNGASGKRLDQSTSIPDLAGNVYSYVAVQNHLEIKYVYNRSTLKYTFSAQNTFQSSTISGDAGKLAMKMYFDELVWYTDKAVGPHVELGFTADDATVIITADASAQSKNVADVNGTVHALYLRTDLPTRSVFESQTGDASDILGKISIDTNPGGIITHRPADTQHETMIQPSLVRSIQLRLTDERNRLLNLNGLHFQVGIHFKFVSLREADPQPAHQIRERPTSDDIERRIQANKKRRRRALQKGKSKVRNAIAASAKITAAPPDP